MAKHENFYTQGTGEGDSRALSSCRACGWAQWGPTGAGIQERIDAAQEHIMAAHLAYPMYESPTDIAGPEALTEILQRNRELLAAGNAFSVEPGIYVPGRWGARLEDIVVVSPDGPDPLNRVDHRLAVVA